MKRASVAAFLLGAPPQSQRWNEALRIALVATAVAGHAPLLKPTAIAAASESIRNTLMTAPNVQGGCALRCVRPGRTIGPPQIEQTSTGVALGYARI